MVTNPSSKEAQDDLNKRLRSLKIDRGPAPSPAANNRSPKLLLLGMAVVLALARARLYLSLLEHQDDLGSPGSS
jgi:hypothetical protein